MGQRLGAAECVALFVGALCVTSQAVSLGPTVACASIAVTGLLGQLALGSLVMVLVARR